LYRLDCVLKGSIRKYYKAIFYKTNFVTSSIKPAQVFQIMNPLITGSLEFLAYSHSGPVRITLAQDDTFTISQKWIELDSSGNISKVFIRMEIHWHLRVRLLVGKRFIPLTVNI